MISLVDKDSIAYGVYAGCLEVLLFIVLFVADFYLREGYEFVLSFCIFTLPIILGVLFIKHSIVKAHTEQPKITGYMLFNEGYTTGLTAIITFVAIMRFSSIVAYITEMDFSNLNRHIFFWIYQDIVIIGMGLISSILISYTFYHLVCHHKNHKHHHTLRRLPGKVSPKKTQNKSTKKSKKKSKTTTKKALKK